MDFENYVNIAYVQYVEQLKHSGASWITSVLLPTIQPNNIRTGGAGIKFPRIAPVASSPYIRSRSQQVSNFATATTSSKEVKPLITETNVRIPYQDLQGMDTNVNIIPEALIEMMFTLSRSIDIRILHDMTGVNYRVDSFGVASSEVTAEDEKIPVINIGSELTMATLNEIVGIANRQSAVQSQEIVIPLPPQLLASFTGSQATQQAVFDSKESIYRLEQRYMFGQNMIRFMTIPEYIETDTGNEYFYPVDEADGSYMTAMYTPESLGFGYNLPSGGTRPMNATISVQDASGLMDFGMETSLIYKRDTLLTGAVTCAATRIKPVTMVVLKFTVPTTTYTVSEVAKKTAEKTTTTIKADKKSGGKV